MEYIYIWRTYISAWHFQKKIAKLTQRYTRRSAIWRFLSDFIQFCLVRTISEIPQYIALQAAHENLIGKFIKYLHALHEDPLIGMQIA